MGLDTMKSWGVIDRNFPKPNSKAFSQSKEEMDAIRLRIAVIEKSLQDSDDSEEKTIETEECKSAKHEIKNIISHQNEESQNIADTVHDESENKEITTESCNKPDES